MAERSSRREIVGTVVSAATAQTILVSVERRFRHQQYGKVMRRTKKYMAHDEHSAASVGDTVKLRESRPLSARKRWRLVEVVSKGASVAENKA